MNVLGWLMETREKLGIEPVLPDNFVAQQRRVAQLELLDKLIAEWERCYEPASIEVVMALVHARTYVDGAAVSDSKAKALQLYDRVLKDAGWRPKGSMADVAERYFCPACGSPLGAKGFCKRCEERAAALQPEDEP